MGQFTDVMALGCIIITMVALVVEHIIEDRQRVCQTTNEKRPK